MSKSTSPVPKKVIEVALSFPEAISAIMGGKKVTRTEWENSDEYGILKDSFLMIHRNGKFHTWLVSEGDMLAIDWMILK